MNPNQKVIQVTGTIGNNQNSFNFNINVEFEVSEVRILYVSKYDVDNANSDYTVLLRSTLFNNQAVLSFPRTASYYQFFNIPIQINKTLNGIYNFELVKYDGSLPTNIASFNTFLSITLLFVGKEKK